MANLGGNFLLNNTFKGLQSKFTTAYEILNEKIKNYDNKKWSMIDYIDKTHNVFVSHIFKPHIPIAFQYLKYSPVNLNNNGKDGIVFNIKPSGSHINDSVIHIKLTKLRVLNVKNKIRYFAFPGHKLN